MDLFLKCIWFIWIFNITLAQIPPKSVANDGDFNNLREDGSYEFGYANKDQGESYHISQANRANVVRGRFGARDPASGTIKETVYTSGPRGFRARGPNVHRKMDLDQRPRGPIGNKDDPYFDPNEDPSYSFGQKTATYEKQEEANRRGDVSGRYSFIDDIGERHNVEYIAGKDTGFHVKTPFPDSNPGSTGPLFYNGPLVRGEKKQRGHTSIQRGVDGSYRFISAGPDQRRTESSDAQGNVRGSYSFLDDKGVQRTVHYIAGPGIGYRVVKNNKDPFIPSFFPVLPDYRDPDLNKPFVTAPDNFIPDVTFPDDKDAGIDDIFGRPGGLAASGHVKPPISNNKPPTKPPSTTTDDGDKSDNSIFDNDDIFGPPTRKPTFSPRPRPTYRPPTFQPTIDTKPNDNKGDDGGFLDSNDGDDDIFGGPSKPSNTNRPTQETSVINNNVGTDNSFDNNDSDDDDIFGSSKPTKPTFGNNNNQNQGFRPTIGSRPTESRPTFGERPGSGGKKPGNGLNSAGLPSTIGRPGSSNRPFPGNRPSNGIRPPFGGRPTYRPTRPTKRPTTSEPDLFGSSEEGYNYDKPSSKPSLDSGEDTSDIFGEPNTGNVGSTSASKPFGPVNRPTSTSSTSDRDKNNQGSSIDDDDDDIFGSSDSKYPLKPPKTTGSTDTTSTISSGTRPGSTDFPDGENLRPTIDSNESTYKPDKPVGPPKPTSPSSSTAGFLDGDDDDDIGGYGSGPKLPPVNQHGVIGNQNSFTTEISLSAANGKDKGGTIFRNIGEELISFPPGASVRAHVQSIDLFPIATKAPTPGEAIDQELKKHGS